MLQQLIKTEILAEELLQDKIEVIDLPPIVDLLESIDNLLIEEFDKDFNSISLNKIRSIRKQLLNKISSVKEELL